MDERPLVSVIVPTYNRTSYLKLTLDSIAAQTYSPVEIIVVDDGSPGDDNEKLCAHYDGLKYIRIQNSGGPATPRNTGLRNASGTFIAWVDDDDIWLPKKLEKQVAILEEHKEFGLVHGPCQIIDEKGEPKDTIIGRPGSLDVKHGDVSGRMAGNWTLMMPTPLLRSELAKEVGFFNEEIPPALEDREYWTRCSFHTKFYYVDEPLVLYRKHDANISSQNKKYVHAPLFLFDMIRKKRQQGIVDALKYKALKNNLIRMQLNYWKLGKGIAFRNLWKMKPLWFLNVHHLRLFLKKVF
ncbi:MAG: glycosyltransferase family A protein [Bacteroidota bacterium]